MKWARWSLAVSLLAGALAAPASAERVTLTFAFVSSDEEMPTWQGIADAWNAQSKDVKVELQRIAGGWDDFRQQMLIRVAAGSPPDIGRMGVALMPAMIQAGALVDLWPYASQDPQFDAQAYFPPALSQYRQGEHLWGMPISVLPMAFYANADLFAERGLALPNRDWNKTWDWSSWRDALRKLTFGQEPNRTYGVHVEPWIERSIQYFWQNGIDILNETRTRSNYTDPRAIEVLRLFSQLWHEDRVAWTERAGLGWGELFHQGRLGMFADGPWMIPWVRQAPFRTAILPFPRGPRAVATVNFIDAWVVFKGSKHPKEAWEVVRFFTERASVEAQLKHGSTGIPSRMDIATERLRSTGLFPGLTSVDQQVWLQAVQVSRAMPFTPNWSQLLNEAITPQTLRLFRNEITPEAAAQAIHDLLQARLK